MILYSDPQIRMRTIQREEVDTLAQGWGGHREKFQQRLEGHQLGKTIALAAEYRRQRPSRNCRFWRAGKYRWRGVGGRLMDAAEQIASTYSSQVYPVVGLHSGYGNAQRMYCKQGYLPEGAGVWYQDQICEQYVHCRNGGDLVLYLIVNKKP